MPTSIIVKSCDVFEKNKSDIVKCGFLLWNKS